jgi:hypothetical protein
MQDPRDGINPVCVSLRGQVEEQFALLWSKPPKWKERAPRCRIHVENAVCASRPTRNPINDIPCLKVPAEFVLRIESPCNVCRTVERRTPEDGVGCPVAHRGESQQVPSRIMARLERTGQTISGNSTLTVLYSERDARAVYAGRWFANPRRAEHGTEDSFPIAVSAGCADHSGRLDGTIGQSCGRYSQGSQQFRLRSVVRCGFHPPECRDERRTTPVLTQRDPDRLPDKRTGDGQVGAHARNGGPLRG